MSLSRKGWNYYLPAPSEFFPAIFPLGADDNCQWTLEIDVSCMQVSEKEKQR